MANAQNIQAKAAQVEEISKKIANAQSVIVFDYRGLNAEEVIFAAICARQALNTSFSRTT